MSAPPTLSGSALQSQKAVYAYLKSGQILPFSLARLLLCARQMAELLSCRTVTGGRCAGDSVPHSACQSHDSIHSLVASELKDPIWHSLEWQIGSFSSEATIYTVQFAPNLVTDLYAYPIIMFTHLKLWIAEPIHNFKCVETTLMRYHIQRLNPFRR